jgi:hypothetical protein
MAISSSGGMDDIDEGGGGGLILFMVIMIDCFGYCDIYGQIFSRAMKFRLSLAYIWNLPSAFG